MSTAVVPFDDKFKTNYPVVLPDSQASELIRQNVGGDTISIGDLDRIKVPSGGATNWQVATLDGDKSEKALEGIIVYSTRRRAYWQSANPTGDVPDCSSKDCVTGVGDPGGACEACPLNEFGTAVKADGGSGRGKACKESRLLFLLRPGQQLPVVVAVPPGSLKAVRQYLLKLPVPYFSCVTRLELKKEKNHDGIPYAQIVPTFVGALDAQAVASVKDYAKALAAVFETVSMERTDVEAE